MIVRLVCLDGVHPHMSIASDVVLIFDGLHLNIAELCTHDLQAFLWHMLYICLDLLAFAFFVLVSDIVYLCNILERGFHRTKHRAALCYYFPCRDLYQILHGIFHPWIYLCPSHLTEKGVDDLEVYLRCYLFRLRLQLFVDSVYFWED